MSKTPRTTLLYRNFISMVCGTIVISSLSSILFLLLTEILGSRRKPYLGIFTYIVFPVCMIFGIAIVITGMILQRRRRHRDGAASGALYPTIDLNDPRRRRSVIIFMGLVFVFLFVSAFGSYRAYEYTDSVTF